MTLFLLTLRVHFPVSLLIAIASGGLGGVKLNDLLEGETGLVGALEVDALLTCVSTVISLTSLVPEP